MVFIKHNSLKSDIFFNPIFIPGFSGSRFFRVHIFQGPGISGSGSRVQVFQGPDPGSSVRVQVLEVARIYGKVCFCINYEDCAIQHSQFYFSELSESILFCSCTELSDKQIFGRYFCPCGESVVFPHIAYILINKLYYDS